MLNHPLIYKSNWIYFLISLLVLVACQFFLLLNHPHFTNIEPEKAIYDAMIGISLLGIFLVYSLNVLAFYRPRKNIFILILLSGMVISAIWAFANEVLLSFIYSDSEYSLMVDELFWYRYFFAIIVMSFGIASSRMHYRIKDLEQQVEQVGDTERAANDAELFKLRQQLQPHFLFNSLNSINALIGLDPPKASKMVLQLSEFFRGTLKREDKRFIPLREELNYIKLYLELEQVRFGHRLNVDIDCGEELAHLPVPPLVLQPLMENAIKFGLYGTTEEVLIKLEVKKEGALLLFDLRNPYDQEGSGIKGTGFGLSSVRRRLYLLFARNDLLKTEAQESLFITRLKLPIHETQSDHH